MEDWKSKPYNEKRCTGSNKVSFETNIISFLLMRRLWDTFNYILACLLKLGWIGLDASVKRHWEKEMYKKNWDKVFCNHVAGTEKKRGQKVDPGL